MKVLVVGAAGNVGRILRPALEKEYDCRYFDICPVEGAENRTTVADVSDDAAVARAVDGIESIIYLAMGKSGEEGINNINASFAVNVAAVYRFVLYGMRGTGFGNREVSRRGEPPRGALRRFIYASSLS